MTLSLLLSMSAFALAASISPGPVNLTCLSSGARYPISRGLRFVTGATLGFIVLFLAIGLGLLAVMEQIPGFEKVLTTAGIAFLLYLSYGLFRDDGLLEETGTQSAPGFWAGALMQWLNPKAWLATASGIGAYTTGDDLSLLMTFAALYLPICWLSLSCWVVAGAFLSGQVRQPGGLRILNRTLAVLLAASCLYLLLGGG